MSRRFSRIDAEALGMLPKKRTKYGAQSCTYEGSKYHSRKEAAYAATLDLLKKAKNPAEKVKSWGRQVRVPLVVNGILIANWYVDFRVTFEDGTEEYHEVKGYATETYRLKRKLFEALYPEKTLKVIR